MELVNPIRHDPSPTDREPTTTRRQELSSQLIDKLDKGTFIPVFDTKYLFLSPEGKLHSVSAMDYFAKSIRIAASSAFKMISDGVVYKGWRGIQLKEIKHILPTDSRPTRVRKQRLRKKIKSERAKQVPEPIGQPVYLIQSPAHRLYVTDSMRYFCREKGLYSSQASTALNKVIPYKGWLFVLNPNEAKYVRT